MPHIPSSLPMANEARLTAPAPIPAHPSHDFDFMGNCNKCRRVEGAALAAEPCTLRIQDVTDSTHKTIIEKLWRGADPILAAKQMPFDADGWNSAHRYLKEAIDRHRPGVIVEVGVWKGASVLTMARRLRDADCDGVVIAVDTWLGSAEHWLNPQTPRRSDGASELYPLFLSNVAHEGLGPWVAPLPLDSASAHRVLKVLDIRPVVIHIDAGHDYESVLGDITRWWDLLLPGGTMIVDDYGGPSWPGVTKAVETFQSYGLHRDFEAAPPKCRMTKR